MNDLADNDALDNLKRMQSSVDHKRLLVEEIEQSLSNLDTTMNFKVNSLLKSEFDKLCKNLILILVVKLNFYASLCSSGAYLIAETLTVILCFS